MRRARFRFPAIWITFLVELPLGFRPWTVLVYVDAPSSDVLMNGVPPPIKCYACVGSSAGRERWVLPDKQHTGEFDNFKTTGFPKLMSIFRP